MDQVVTDCCLFNVRRLHPGPSNLRVPSLPFYVTNIVLDGVDGFVEWQLDQISVRGAWSDVVADKLGWAMVWGTLFKWGWLLSSHGRCVFMCTHSARGPCWKSIPSESFQRVQVVMANGFKTPVGVLVMEGLHILPMWLYAYQQDAFMDLRPVPLWLQVLGLLVLAAGRVLCLAVAVWVMDPDCNFPDCLSGISRELQ